MTKSEDVFAFVSFATYASGSTPGPTTTWPHNRDSPRP
jgi:hypothetical protein